MKTVYILCSVVVVALCVRWCCANGCDSVVERLDPFWPQGTDSSSVLEIICCATLLASLQVRRNSVVLNASEIEQRNITIGSYSGSGYCVEMMIPLLEENVNGDLVAKCNAEKGGYEQPCDIRFYRIVPPAPTPSTTESTTESTTMKSKVTLTDTTTQETGPGSTPVKTVGNATTSSVDSGSGKNKSAVIIGSVAAAILIIVSVAVGICVFAIVMVKHRKCCTARGKAQFTTPYAPAYPKSMCSKDEGEIIDSNDGEGVEESEIPQQSQDTTTSTSVPYRRRRVSLPAPSMARNDFIKNVSSAPDLTQLDLQSFNDGNSQEVTHHSNDLVHSSVQCTDKSTSDHGGWVFV